MIKLKYADYKGIFHGFNLKEGFWYGVDERIERKLGLDDEWGVWCMFGGSNSTYLGSWNRVL